MTDQLRILTPTNEPRTAEDVVNDAAASGDVGAWTLSEATGPQWQYALDANGDPQVTEDGAVAELLPYAGNITLSEATAADRPILDKSLRLLEFVSSDSLGAAWGTRTATSYAVIAVKTTDTSAVLLTSSTASTAYVGRFEDTSSSTTLNEGSGTVTYTIDGTAFSGTTRDDLHTALADDAWHLLEIEFDGTGANWANFEFGKFTGADFVGRIIPLYLGPEPSASDKDILRERWYEQYPQIAPTSGATLTAETGDFTLTGVSAPVTASRNLDAAQASFDVTGIAADLTVTVALELVADTQSYTLTGVSAPVLYDRLLALNQGSLAFTGVDADLTRNISLDAAAGSFALSGVNVALEYTISNSLTDESSDPLLDDSNGELQNDTGLSNQFAANAGDFALSGLDAGVLRGREPLQASQVSFVLTGVSAGLTASLLALPRHYSFTGNAASLQYGTAFDASTGSFVLSGPSISFGQDLVLAADTGTFGASGNAALFERGLSFSVDTESFVLTGVSANFTTADRSLIADSGSFSLTPVEASLIKDSLISVSQRTFWVTLQPASLSAQAQVTLLDELGDALNDDTGEVLYNESGGESYRIDAGRGAFTAVGADALVVARNTDLDVDTGSFALSGVSVSFGLGLVVAADTGSFDLDLRGAGLRSENIVPDPAFFDVSTYSASLSVSLYNPPRAPQDSINSGRIISGQNAARLVRTGINGGRLITS